jgi:nucleotide-binding universal stress UspA family protein
VPEESPGTETVDNVGAVRVVVDRLEAAGIDYEIIDAGGEPDEVILDTLEEFEPDELVVSSGGQSSIGKALFGSTNRTVLLTTDVPVVFIAPEQA